MDYQVLFNIVGGIATFFMGWWMKSLHENLKELREQDSKLADKVAQIEVLVAGQYVTRDAMEKFMEAMFTKLDKIEFLVHNKADRQ